MRSFDSSGRRRYRLLKMRISRNLEEGDASASHACEDVRCGCGCLLARVVDGAVELKCRRCKHVWRLPVEGAPRPLARPDRIDAR
jgi:hypothetical protein